MSKKSVKKLKKELEKKGVAVELLNKIKKDKKTRKEFKRRVKDLDKAIKENEKKLNKELKKLK